VDGGINENSVARGKLTAFISIVNSKESRHQVTSDQAIDLRKLATQVKADLGC